MSKVPTTILVIFTTMQIAACSYPISAKTRAESNPELTLAMVSDTPSAYLGQKLVLGGSIISIEENDEGSTLELMEWQLDRWGEPSYIDDQGRRFMVKSTELLDRDLYMQGVLVTLAGAVLGQETRSEDGQEHNYPILSLIEIHPWENPFRYGRHRNVDPGTPEYVKPDDDQENPYDPGYAPYPYTPYWYRTPR